MNCVDVRTQAELEAATKKGDCAHLRGDGYFTASGSAQVTAYGSAQVRASDSAQVTAYGSAQVTAYDSAQVTASDSAQVRASGSAQVTAYDSAQVTASDSAQVRASGSAQVTAGHFVAVTVHGVRTKVTGGVVITLPTITTAAEWCDFYGVEVTDGIATLYKAVDANFRSPHGFDYTPGTTPIAPDWDGGRNECGGGLHFSPRPAAALRFFDDGFKTKFIACPVRLSDIVVHRDAMYPDKIKSPGCAGPVWECDIDGERVPAKEEAA